MGCGQVGSGFDCEAFVLVVVNAYECSAFVSLSFRSFSFRAVLVLLWFCCPITVVLMSFW